MRLTFNAFKVIFKHKTKPRTLFLYEKQSKLPDKLQSLFELIKPQIDANIKRRINSKKGGRKPNKE